MIKIANDYLNEKNIYNGLFFSDQNILALYFTFQQSVIFLSKLCEKHRSDSSKVLLPLGVKVNSRDFFAATACSPRAFSTQRWLASLMCELSLTSRTLFKRTKFTKPPRSAGQGRTDYPSLTCLSSLRERQRS